MTRVVSATQARIRFGELIRWVMETHQPVTVERDGEPCVVVLSVEAYRRLQEGQARSSWQETLSQIRNFRTRWTGGLSPSPEEVIQGEREERDAHLTSLS
ncbi:MAG: type II toxin-antitoxin system Phd/YefM family antitoxin [Roseiflexaceae bacterium]|nr:type II toxin-antitoxin system Phd/YefM family antitoxin [Roseiflexus sp.]MDW8214249.1 type II toxin-antitoxin system Phd/YefM family antitoxin [Roseiflexaceae bacterium]